MKYYIYLCITLCTSWALQAQISIGKDTPLDGAILDFELPTNKGIALPKITSLDASSVPGTMYFDTADGKVKFKLNTGDLDLSGKESVAFDVNADGYTDQKETASLHGAVIGEDSIVPGVLVLEANDSALIVPNVANPITAIADPEPGMIAYDTTKKVLCIFNGIQWSTWGQKGVRTINN